MSAGLRRRAGRSGLHRSVADPAGTGTDEAFERAFDELTARVVHVAPAIRR